MDVKENPQRSKNFWESIYSPEKDNRYKKWEVSDEGINRISGIKQSWIRIGELDNLKKKHIKNFSFDYVDFYESFEKSYLTFDDCKFSFCSFYRSKWENVKFRNCKFRNSSFSIVIFENCEFRDCTFDKISISANEMKFINTFIDSYSLISSATTNLDPDILRENNTNSKYQSYRLEGTKSSAARMLLQMKPIRNNIDSFMRAKHIARKCESYSHIKKGLYELTTGHFKQRVKGLLDFVLYSTEYLFISALGWLSGWGLKTGKALLMGFIFTNGFALYYSLFMFKNETYFSNYIRVLEYWFLFGYTKYPFKPLPFSYQLIIFLNALFGLFWFATILPVLMEKMGKESE